MSTLKRRKLTPILTSLMQGLWEGRTTKEITESLTALGLLKGTAEDLNNAFKEAVRSKAWALCQLLLALEVTIKIEQFELSAITKHQPTLLKGRFRLLEEVNADQQDLLGTPQEIVKYLVDNPTIKLGHISLYKCLSYPETFPYYLQLLERDPKPHIPTFKAIELDRQLEQYLTAPKLSKTQLSTDTLKHILNNRTTANKITDLLLKEVYGTMPPTSEETITNPFVFARYPKDSASLLTLTKNLLTDYANSAYDSGPHAPKLPALLSAIETIKTPLPVDVLEVALSRVGYNANRNACFFLALGVEHLNLYLPTFVGVTGTVSVISLFTNIKHTGSYQDSVYISKSTLPFISWIIKYSVKSRPGQKTLNSVANTLLRLWDKPGHLELQDVLDLFNDLHYGSQQTKILSLSYREDQLKTLGAAPSKVHLTNAIKNNAVTSVTYLVNKLKGTPSFDSAHLTFLAVEFRALEVLPILSPYLSKPQQERLEVIIPFLKDELLETPEDEENQETTT